MLGIRYPKIRDMEMAILRQTLTDKTVRQGFTQKIRAALNGEIPHAMDIILALAIPS